MPRTRPVPSLILPVKPCKGSASPRTFESVLLLCYAAAPRCWQSPGGDGLHGLSGQSWARHTGATRALPRSRPAHDPRPRPSAAPPLGRSGAQPPPRLPPPRGAAPQAGERAVLRACPFQTGLAPAGKPGQALSPRPGTEKPGPSSGLLE